MNLRKQYNTIEERRKEIDQIHRQRRNCHVLRNCLRTSIQTQDETLIDELTQEELLKLKEEMEYLDYLYEKEIDENDNVNDPFDDENDIEYESYQYEHDQYMEYINQMNYINDVENENNNENILDGIDIDSLDLNDENDGNNEQNNGNNYQQQNTYEYQMECE